MGFMGLTFRNAHGVRALAEMKQAKTSGNLEGGGFAPIVAAFT
jgi:hypothetical protein